jgi:hypothetical protein
VEKFHSLASKDLKVITTVQTTTKISGVYKWRIIKLKRYILLERGCGKCASSCRQEFRTWCSEFGVCACLRARVRMCVCAYVGARDVARETSQHSC